MGVFVTPLMGLTLGDPFEKDNLFQLKVMFGLPAIPLLVRLGMLCCLFNYETPKFLLLESKKSLARIVIRNLYTKSSILPKIESIIGDI